MRGAQTAASLRCLRVTAMACWWWTLLSGTRPPSVQALPHSACYAGLPADPTSLQVGGLFTLLALIGNRRIFCTLLCFRVDSPEHVGECGLAETRSTPTSARTGRTFCSPGSRDGWMQCTSSCFTVYGGKCRGAGTRMQRHQSGSESSLLWAAIDNS